MGATAESLIAAGRSLIGTPREIGWYEALDRRRTEVAELLEDALERADGPALARYGAALWRYWFHHAPDGDKWLRRLTEATADEPPSADLGQLRYGAATAAFRRGDGEGSRRLSEDALRIAEASESPQVRALALVGLARIFWRDADFERGRSFSQDAAGIAGDLGDEPLVTMAVHQEAEICRASGDYAAAAPLYQRLIARERSTGNIRRLSTELFNLGSVLLLQGDLYNAARHLHESLELAVECGASDQVPYCLLGFAGLAGRNGDALHAGRWIGAVEAYFERHGEVMDPNEQLELDSHVAAGRAAGTGFDEAREAGREIPISEAVADIARSAL